jgi:hypothetical protein
VRVNLCAKAETGRPSRFQNVFDFRKMKVNFAALWTLAFIISNQTAQGFE